MDTTIRVNKITHAKLVKIGKKNESFDKIINKILNENGWVVEK